MPSILANLISLASYVLYSLGLYTIAKRRGINNPWLAWIPVGSVWILGYIADDYRTRQTGRKRNLRTWLVALTIAMSVLLVVVMVLGVLLLSNVLTINEMTDLYLSAAGGTNDLYSVSQEEMIQQLSEKIEARVTDEVAERVFTQSLVLLAISLLMLVVATAVSVMELLCTYNLFASCDPQNKLLFFLLGIVLGVMSVFVFLCREKDLGMAPPPPPVAGYMPPAPDRDPWEQN